MSEADAVLATPEPRSEASLRADLEALGVAPGAVLLVHASLSSLGWVCGGPVAVLRALRGAVGEAGTLCFPAFSAEYSEPSHWRAPAVPEAWWATIRETMPAFDPARTPTRGLGQLAELFRTWPGVLRSRHPCSSFAAWGPEARRITESHGYEVSMGNASPLGRLYELGAEVLFLGVGYERCTAFHLAESRVPGRPRRREGGAVLRRGRRVWLEYENVAYDDAEFPALGAAFEAASGLVTRGRVGSSEARRFPMRAAVDYAVAAFAAAG